MITIKFNYLKKILIIAIISVILNCINKKEIYYLATAPPGTQYYAIGKDIANFISNYSEINLKLLSGHISINEDTIRLSARNNCTLLSEGLADFAISQNDVGVFYSNIRTILPLYSEVFFIIYKDFLKPKSLKDLIIGRKIAMGPENSGTARFTKALFEKLGIDSSEYQPQYLNFAENQLSDTIDICCLVTALNNSRIQKSLDNGGNIFSLDDYKLADKYSVVDGFCLRYPWAKPFIIPKNFYSKSPKEPILTVAIDAVLLTRNDINNDVVYELFKTMITHKQILLINNRILNLITENFVPNVFFYPLHDGAKQYLERNKPSVFLVRYAEIIGLAFSIFVTFIGSISYIFRWKKNRKKNLIKKYYSEIIDIEKRIKISKNKNTYIKLLEQLKNLRKGLFELLLDEKIIANDIFKMIIHILNDTQAELEKRIYRLEKNKNSI